MKGGGGHRGSQGYASWIRGVNRHTRIGKGLHIVISEREYRCVDLLWDWSRGVNFDSELSRFPFWVVVVYPSAYSYC
jgi:hypothetical protein